MTLPTTTVGVDEDARTVRALPRANLLPRLCIPWAREAWDRLTRALWAVGLLRSGQHILTFRHLLGLSASGPSDSRRRTRVGCARPPRPASSPTPRGARAVRRPPREVATAQPSGPPCRFPGTVTVDDESAGPGRSVTTIVSGAQVWLHRRIDLRVRRSRHLRRCWRRCGAAATAVAHT